MCVGMAPTLQMAWMSQICMRGFVGDSMMTSLVRPGMMPRPTALRIADGDVHKVGLVRWGRQGWWGSAEGI